MERPTAPHFGARSPWADSLQRHGHLPSHLAPRYALTLWGGCVGPLHLKKQVITMTLRHHPKGQENYG